MAGKVREYFCCGINKNFHSETYHRYVSVLSVIALDIFALSPGTP